MNSQNSSQQSFKADYALLQLNEQSDWPAARNSYRRLVHIWHPDKFAQRPRERAHAQQQFIDLTKSYNTLRNYHRSHNRLPFQRGVRQAAQNAGDAHTPEESAYASAKEGELQQSDDFTSSVFGRPATTARPKRWYQTHTWIAPVVLMMFATVFFLVIQDKKANSLRLKQAQDTIKQAPESEFLTDTDKIRQTQTREAYLKPPK